MNDTEIIEKSDMPEEERSKNFRKFQSEGKALQKLEAVIHTGLRSELFV